MSRLIDADKLMLHLNDYALQVAPFRDMKSTIKYNTIQECMKVVKEAPIAYNVEKVIDQLKAEGCIYDDASGNRAVEIIKAGGMDE